MNRQHNSAFRPALRHSFAISPLVAAEERLRLLRARLIRDEQRVEQSRLAVRELEQEMARMRGEVARG